jgi:hypothetical protein
MGELFRGEPDPFDVTVTASVSGYRLDNCIVSVILENGMDAEGGDVELCITDTARNAYGLDACIDEFERWLNATLRPEYRLDAALAMSQHGAFSVVATPTAGPSVLPPPMSGASDLAA